MAINLVKGQKIDLTKGNPSLKKVIMKPFVLIFKNSVAVF